MLNRIPAALAAIAGLLGLLGGAGNARATATITLEWGACGGGAGGCAGVGTSTLSLLPGGGQTLRLDVFLQHDEPTGLTAHVFSLNFDTDLRNELNLTAGMAPVEWAGTDTHPSPNITEIYGPITAGTQGNFESSGAVAGHIDSIDSASLFSTLPRTGVAYTVGTFTATAPARYRVAQAFFTVTANGGIDGPDVFSGAFNGLADVTVDGNFPANVVTMNFGTATVNMAMGGPEPEPGGGPGGALPEPGSGVLLGFGLLGLLMARRRGRRG